MSKELKEDKEEVKEEEIGEDEKVLFINLEEEAWRREELTIRMRNKNVERLEKNISQEYQDFKD